MTAVAALGCSLKVTYAFSSPGCFQSVFVTAAEDKVRARVSNALIVLIVGANVEKSEFHL